MSKSVNFEKSMMELDEIVKQLEKGELSLEDSLKYYEKGINLARKCQDALTQAEQKIEMLRITATECDGTTDE
ncbi:exodeoxyribonuclease VII small subunit [Legionella dresdenensis]|uniref:Exodeoxyribonuclease 7 small subunit n=1 Tax=Legionella dresdenensis TaxID=450200 RepID=A0ABV8CH78_9GAMM